MARTGSTDISLFGVATMRVACNGPLQFGIAGPTLELLAYLFTFSCRPMRRDHLADVIWQDLDEPRSRAALNTALWRARQVVRALPGVTLMSDSVNVRLDLADDVTLDTTRLKTVTHAAVAAFAKEDGLPDTLRGELHDVLERQSGEFLEGFSSSWVLAEREEYVNLGIRGLTILMQDAGVRAVYEDALHYGRRILALDPFREAVHCQMLWLMMMTGRRANAIKHYRDYKKTLQSELGVQPMAETRAVYEMVCADETGPSRPESLHQGPDRRPGALRFGHMLNEIESGRRAFYRSHFATGV